MSVKFLIVFFLVTKISDIITRKRYRKIEGNGEEELQKFHKR